MFGSHPPRIEPGPGQESVWDYPRPPRLEKVAERIRVEHAGVLIADTTRAMRVCETASPPTYYLPPEDVRTELLETVRRRTLCEWKGLSSYWSLRVGEDFVPDAAWSYPQPTPSFAEIRDYLAFFAGRVDACYVGEERVEPQAGDFYGGWATRKIVGPFKGEPGTLGW